MGACTMHSMCKHNLLQRQNAQPGASQAWEHHRVNARGCVNTEFRAHMWD